MCNVSIMFTHYSTASFIGNLLIYYGWIFIITETICRNHALAQSKNLESITIGNEQTIWPSTITLYIAVYNQQEIPIVKRASNIQLNINN